MSHLYPSRTPDTTAALDAFLSEAIAARRAAGVTMRPAAIGKVTPKNEFRADVVARMADQMLDFGEGMTNADLNRIHGWSYPIIEACAAEANELARSRANLN